MSLRGEVTGVLACGAQSLAQLLGLHQQVRPAAGTQAAQLARTPLLLPPSLVESWGPHWTREASWATCLGDKG